MNQKTKLLLTCILLFHISLGIYTTFYMMLASMIYFTQIWGLSLRKTNYRAHAKFMTIAIVLDVVLVLVLELSRGAINTTLNFELNTLQQAHIYTSLCAVLLYMPTFYYGRKRLHNLDKAYWAQKHKKFALTAFTFRTLGYILMYSFLMQ